jgi:hypothetical protein
MTNEVVSRKEFEKLEQKVDRIEATQAEDVKILQAIDKKVDVITEKIMSAGQIEDLKLEPINKRVTELEESKKWLWRTVAGALILEGLNILSGVSKMIK